MTTMAPMRCADDDHAPRRPRSRSRRSRRPRARGWPKSSPPFLLLICGRPVMGVLVNVGFMHQDARIVLFPWINSGDLNVSWALRVDTLTAVMLVVVNTVSSLVHLYSIGYMAEDPHRPRFMALSVAVHLRDADAGDGRQSRADVLRLGRRGSRELSADRFLVRAAVRQCRRDQGLHRQPRRRLRLCARHLRDLHADRLDRLRDHLRTARRPRRQDQSISSAGMPTR